MDFHRSALQYSTSLKAKLVQPCSSLEEVRHGGMEGKKKKSADLQFNSKHLTSQFNNMCISAKSCHSSVWEHNCACMCVYMLSSKEVSLLSCSFMQKFLFPQSITGSAGPLSLLSPSPPLFNFLSFFSLWLLLPLPSHMEEHHLAYIALSVMRDSSITSVCSGFFCSKDSIKNNYQKISSSWTWLYCLNWCFLFIWFNNRMLS